MPTSESRPLHLAIALIFVAAIGPACVPDTELSGDAGPSGDVPHETGGADTGADSRTDATSADTGGVDVTSDAATDASGDTEVEPRPVTERGPHPVGYREMTVTHQAVHDGTDEDRELNLSVWYPRASPPRGEVKVPARYAGLRRRDPVARDAPMVDGSSFPLLVFSHGNGALAEQSFFMTEFWASHGWVVAAPDHTGNTFQSGTSIDMEAAIYRPQDISAVLDHVLDLPEDDPLHGKISDDIVMTGHSFGAVTTLLNAGTGIAVDALETACKEGDVSRDDYCDVFTRESLIDLFQEGFNDPRIDVAIPQAPGGADVFRDGLEEIDIPTMVMTGGMDATLSNAEEGDPIWMYMKGPRHRRLNLPRAGHFTFSNMCELFPGAQQVESDGCADRFIEPTKAFDIINTYSLAYARWHLWEDAAAREIVDGERFPHGQSELEFVVGAD